MKIENLARLLPELPTGGPVLHLGGPDQPPRQLRNLLRERIDAVPAGGEIAWATYYFRDRDLAQALIDAVDRGVEVVLQVEGTPRRACANQAVLTMLGSHGLGGGLRVHSASFPALHPHLHSKIYYFSHPFPTVLVGSFNPSGDEPEDSEVIAEIGDQDRGHNLLVEFTDPSLVQPLRDHVREMGKPMLRLRHLGQVTGRDATAWFFPRFNPALVDKSLRGAGSVTGCISHLKKGALIDGLCRAAKAGASVRLLVHDTSRRVPEAAMTTLQDAGIEVTRFKHPEDLPLHAKFLVIDATAWFGSFNYNPRSRWLNREILLASQHPRLIADLHARFDEIASAVHQHGG